MLREKHWGMREKRFSLTGAVDEVVGNVGETRTERMRWDGSWVGGQELSWRRQGSIEHTEILHGVPGTFWYYVKEERKRL
jgi:hypothetical protein